jgi:hypothetical protein
VLLGLGGLLHAVALDADGAPQEESYAHHRTATAFPAAAQAARRRDVPGRDQFVRPAPSAKGKAAKTIRTYTEAVRWFAATGRLGQAGRGNWERVTSRDIQRWMA